MLYEYDERIFGDINLINKTVVRILSEITPIIKDEDIRFDLRLVLSELLINCHEHGNKCDNKKCIDLILEISRKNIYIEVTDEGSGIVNEEVYNIHDCKASGRGLMIVKSLVDKMVIDKNSIRCEIYI